VSNPHARLPAVLIRSTLSFSEPDCLHILGVFTGGDPVHFGDVDVHEDRRGLELPCFQSLPQHRLRKRDQTFFHGHRVAEAKTF